MCEDVAKAAGEEVGDLLKKLRENSMERWKAIGMLKHVFLSTDYSWKIKAYGVELILNVMDVVAREDRENDCLERLILVPGIFASLQVSLSLSSPPPPPHLPFPLLFSL